MNFKFIAIVFLLTLIAFSCENSNELDNKAEISLQNTSQEVFENSVSIFDIRIRPLTQNTYAQEIILTAFGGYEIQDKEFITANMLYKDDGSGHDLIANDGIFTSVKESKFSSKAPYNKSTEIKSILAKPIVNDNFLYENELASKLKTYELRTSDINKAEITIKCKVAIRECPNEHWWDTSWFGEPCLHISDCSVTIR